MNLLKSLMRVCFSNLCMVTTYCFERQCQPWQLFLWTGMYLQLSHDAFKSSIVPFCACFVLSSHVRCKIVFLCICSNKSNTNDYPLCLPKCHCGSTGISLLNSWLLEYQRHWCYLLLMKIVTISKTMTGCWTGNEARNSTFLQARKFINLKPSHNDCL